MLELERITLFHFRNYIQQEFNFNEKVIGICGLNGSGKTNLLDAIYYLGFTKSYFNRSDSSNIHIGLQGMRIKGMFQLHNQPHEVSVIIRENNRKEFSYNGNDYKKLSEHIGRFPCVMIAPDDVELIVGGSEERRKFMDTLLSQIDFNYLSHLISYTKILQQRNSLLKQTADTGRIDTALLVIFNQQLSEHGTWIFEQRKLFFLSFLQQVVLFYKSIAGSSEDLSIAYQSDLLFHGNETTTSMIELLDASKSKDLALQRTTVGIHKDDLVIKMGEANFKSQASQGQRKSLLFALKLAEWQTLKNKKGFAPILLLDDVFEKLDQQRMHNLLQWVCSKDGGQIFITDTHAERLAQQMSALGVNFQLVNNS